MKQFLLSLLLIASYQNWAIAESKSEADQNYSKRDFTPDGISAAKSAAEMYNKLGETAKGTDKNEMWIGEAKSYYFVGTGSKDKNNKIAFFQKGMDASTKVLKVYNLVELKEENLEATANDIRGKYSPNEVKEIAFALYYQGINLGAWAEANGVTQSLGKWPTLRTYISLIQHLGHRDIAHYGASRVLGRAYFKLPVFAGGSMEKAGRFLNEAFTKTVTKEGGPSVNGNNNLFYAEYLHKGNKEQKAEAVSILKNFVNTPAEQLDPEMIPENKLAQKTAKELLSDWE